jgi:hypothetical protein
VKRAFFFFFLLFSALPALAWGEHGHSIVNEAATVALPTDMPHFFHQAYPELIWLAYDPDRWKSGNFPSLDAVNDPDHFLDYEYVAGLELPESRYKFIDLMYTSGRLRKQGIHNAEAGFVPWRVAELTQTLQVHFRNWRFSVPGSTERMALERDIIHIAGILGHYVGDSANPHHATAAYNGWIWPNPNRYAIDCGTHARFESNFVSHAVDVKDVNPKVVAKPILYKDYFATALQSIRDSNALVETIYRIDRDGGFELIGPVNPVGFEFATDRLAAGATMLRDLWWSAWVNSAASTRERR